MAGIFIGLAIAYIAVVAILIIYSRQLASWIRALPSSTWDYVSDRFGAAGDWVLGIALSAIAINQFLPSFGNAAQPYVLPLLVITMLLWFGGWYVKP
jgi:hypothetical protein